MLSINLFSCSYLSICDFLLSVSNILLIDCDNESFIDLMLSINLFLGSLLLISDQLSTKFDSESCINLVVLPSSCSFLIGAEKVIYFSVFSPKQSKLPLTFLANCLIMK